MKLRNPDRYVLYPEKFKKAEIILEESDDFIDVYVKSADGIEGVSLFWDLTKEEKRSENVKVLGDAWERSYGELAWKRIDGKRIMPWYFAVSDGSDSVEKYKGRFTECFGVAVQPDALCSWQYSRQTVTLNLDLRNGNLPLLCGGRTIHACRIFFREYRDMSAFESLRNFCAVMSPSPLKTKNIIYGSNNWYYAYGRDCSSEKMVKDAENTALFCEGNENKPYAVIDDGWQINSVTAPWIPNERFGDMKKLAKKMRASGVIPGIWVRYLVDEKFALDIPDEARRPDKKEALDPTHPAIREHIINTTKYLTSCGYKLIKHDFSTCDIAFRWGKDAEGMFYCSGTSGFYDRTKTTAQVFKDFYKLILDCAGNTIILGCNTISHLCAGLVHANRTGDDTSGLEWSRTRKMGINTLAFRACQNNSFYIVDADCVGITGKIDWKLNRDWLFLVAHSGTSLFVSCHPDFAKGEILRDLKKAFINGGKQEDRFIPLDWMEKKIPTEYRINGRKYKFDF